MITKAAQERIYQNNLDKSESYTGFGKRNPVLPEGIISKIEPKYVGSIKGTHVPQQHLNSMNCETGFAIKKLTWKWVSNELLPKHKQRIETKPLTKDTLPSGINKKDHGSSGGTMITKAAYHDRVSLDLRNFVNVSTWDMIIGIPTFWRYL